MFDRNIRPSGTTINRGRLNYQSVYKDKEMEDPETEMKQYITFRPQAVTARMSIQSSVNIDSPPRSELMGSTKN